jgi:hypothetical protein
MSVMSDLQLEYTARELLMTASIAEPLMAGGVRCHGGFDESGVYVSPRTRFRVDAIKAWQRHHLDNFNTDLLVSPLETWPRHYPNVKQVQLLLHHGARGPLVAALTRIGTVEGFGAMIRYMAPADMQKFFVESVRGTAIDHLAKGLVEAHARDEAGWKAEAGHKDMWFAARDIAFENPLTEDEVQRIVERMGFAASQSGPAAQGDKARFVPDLDGGLELLISTMLRVLFIEVKAFHTFAWAEELLSNDELVAGDGEAGRLVSYIRADETPHVEYLRTALTEMRDRTFIGVSGKRYPGRDVIMPMWDALLEFSLGVVEQQNRAWSLREVERAIDGKPGNAEILREFHELGTAA